MRGTCLAWADGEEHIGLGKNQSSSLHKSGHIVEGEGTPRRSIVAAVY
jgi:hypothetical protein